MPGLTQSERVLEAVAMEGPIGLEDILAFNQGINPEGLPARLKELESRGLLKKIASGRMEPFFEATAKGKAQAKRRGMEVEEMVTF